MSNPHNPRFKIFYGYIVLAAISLIYFTIWGAESSFTVFLKPIMDEFGWGRAAAAGSRSLMALMIGLASIITGRLADKIGPKNVSLIFGALFVIGFFLMTQIRELWQLYVVYGLVVGLSMGSAGTPSIAMIPRWFVKRRGLMIGTAQSMSAFGSVVMAPVAGWLVVTNGWRFGYAILAIFALVVIATMAPLLKGNPQQMGLLPYGTTDTPPEKEVKPAAPGYSLRRAVHTRQFWMLLLILFGFGFCRNAVSVHIAAHAIDLGFSLGVGAVLLAIMNGVSFVARVIMGRVSDTIGNRLTLAIGYAAFIASLVWVPAAKELWMLYVFAAVFGLAWGTVFVSRITLIAEIFGIASLPLIIGVIDFVTQVGSAVGPLVAGWVFDITGFYTIAFLVGAGLSAIALVLTLLLKPIDAQAR